MSFSARMRLAVAALRVQHVLEEHASRLREVPRSRPGLGLDVLEDEVGGVDLAVGMRVGDAHDLALVLEDEDVRDALHARELAILRLPDPEKGVHFGRAQLGEAQVVLGRVAHDAGHAGRGPVAVDRRQGRQIGRGQRSHAGMVVVEDEGLAVVGVARAADARVAGAEIAVRNVLGQRPLLRPDHVAAPRPVLPVGGDDDPLLAQGMPALFPGHSVPPSWCRLRARGRK